MKKLMNATVIVIVLTFISKLTGFIREQVIAFQYGANNIADTYSTVLSLPQYISNIIGGVVLSCFIPLYISIKQKNGIRKAEKFSSNIFSFILISLIFLNVIFYVFSDEIARMYFGENMTKAQLSLITTILPIQIFLSLSMFFTAKLNANENYNSPIASTILMNCLFIFIVIFFEKSSKTLVLATMISSIGQIVYLLYKVRFRFTFNLKKLFLNYNDIKQFLLLGTPVMIGSFSVQAYTISDKILARNLPEGSIASLSYAQKLTQLPVGIIAMAISTVLLSSLSILASKGEIQKLNKELFKNLNLTLLLLIPIILVMYFLAVPITKTLFERGEFDHNATIMTAKAVKAYSIGILGISLTTVLSRVFFAFKNTIIPVISNIFSAFLNLIFALILVKYYQHVGLAVANTISVIFNFLFLLIAYLLKNKKFLNFDYKKSVGYLMSYILITILLYLELLLIKEFINPIKSFVSLVLYVTVFFIIYVCMLYFIKIFFDRFNKKVEIGEGHK